MGSKEKAQDGHNEFHRRAQQSSADFRRSVSESHSSFESSTRPTHLDSGRSSTPEPAQATGGGSLELTMTTMVGLTAALGGLAAAALLGRRNHGNK